MLHSPTCYLLDRYRCFTVFGKSLAYFAKETQPEGYEKDHKVVNLYGDQISAYTNAKHAVKQEMGEDVTEGEVVRKLSEAYAGWDSEEKGC